MKLYRIVRKRYASSLSGEGARLFGGRWNTKGVSLIYTAQTSSLAMLEMLVQRNVQLVGVDYYLVTIEVPDLYKPVDIPIKDLPLAWNNYPPTTATKAIGDDFVNARKNLLLSVPSVVNSLESNYLINDHHPDFNKVQIVSSKQIVFDDRLTVRA